MRFQSDVISVQRLQRLPVLFFWLLCLVGVVASSGEAWVHWLGTHSATQNSLKLADLDPDHELAHLTKALEEDSRNLSALLRLALHAEFGGDLPRAESLLAEARRYHHSFKSYMASLSFAARHQQRDQIQSYGKLALQYCPGDADGVYMLLGQLAQAQPAIPAERRADYLRHLVAQNRIDEALVYQPSLPVSEAVDRQRLTLAEALILKSNFDRAAKLVQPADSLGFETQPTSLGFDWRLSQNPLATIHWRQGGLEVSIGETGSPLEVASIYVAAGRSPRRRAMADWTGETRGLSWSIAEAAPGWLRVALTAPAGAARRFTLAKLRLE